MVRPKECVFRQQPIDRIAEEGRVEPIRRKRFARVEPEMTGQQPSCTSGPDGDVVWARHLRQVAAFATRRCQRRVHARAGRSGQMIEDRAWKTVGHVLNALMRR
jgi:hypothetical protein